MAGFGCGSEVEGYQDTIMICGDVNRPVSIVALYATPDAVMTSVAPDTATVGS
jgi:hypothetical protein